MNRFTQHNFQILIASLFFFCPIGTKATACVFQDQTNTLLSQEENFRKGIEALKAKDTLSAEKYFKESIRVNGDAASHVELAKIYLHRNSYNSRNLAYENLQTAVLMEPNNIEYKYLYADICQSFARFTAYDQYKQITELDSNQTEAWISLGKMKDEDYSEYNNSSRVLGDDFLAPLQEYADKDFLEAEKYYKCALKIDYANYNASLKLSLLYEKAGQPQKGIPLLKRLEKLNKADKEIFLCMGLLYYKTSKMKESFEAYKKALTKMNEDERKDFTFNSVKMLLKPVMNNEIDRLSDYELNQVIDQFWKISDPLFLTNYNERMLEHYSRVAYANLFFSVPKMGIVGWKSDRGEIVLRYGEPEKLTRIRPQMGGLAVGLKTEIWKYPDMTFAFTDLASSGNFQFSVPGNETDKVRSQYAGDTQFYAEYLRKARFEYYTPKFEGPKFDVDYDLAQFKSSEQRNHTDLYVSYGLTTVDSLLNAGKLDVSHTAAFYFFNDLSEEEINKKIKVDSLEPESIVKIPGGKPLYTNVLDVTSVADSGYYSFELLRDRDKGVAVKRANLRIKKFSNIRLDMSDIILASDVQTDKPEKFCVNRDGVNIRANPAKKFSKGEPLFVYYEVYNLKKSSSGITNFTQNVEIRDYNSVNKSRFEKTLDDMLSIFGKKREEKIALTSNYQTEEINPKQYFQLDLSKVKTGKYLITIKIKDQVSGAETSASTVIDWVN